MNQKILLTLLIAFALIGVSTFVIAVPSGPKTLNVTDTQTWAPWDSINITAVAGNVSELIFNGSTVTRTFQGYYGNITGFIVLGNAQNQTLYDWSLSNPQGEIYAVRDYQVPTWGSVTCAQSWELQEEDNALGVNETIDEDSVNNTFVVDGAPDQIARFGSSELVHPQFYVANQSIAANDCPLAVMYNSSSMPSPYFKQVLLSDNVHTNASAAGGFVIYTAIIAHTLNPFDDSDGFDTRDHDFEMIVGDNGHGAHDAATADTSTYWFYVELD